MLKHLIDVKEFESLPDAIKEHYVKDQDSDNYLLESDNSEFKQKINEFRSNNINLRKKTEELQRELEKFKDVDIEKYNEVQTKLQEIEEQKLIDANKFDELFDKRTERMRGEYEGRITALESSLEETATSKTDAEKRLSGILLNSRVSESVSKVGTVKQGAMQFITSAAEKDWHLIDNELVPMKGKDVIYGKDGKAQLTMEEWATDLMESNSFLFEGSQGSGSQGNTGSGSSKARSIDRTDSGSFSSNLESIAKGEVKAV